MKATDATTGAPRSSVPTHAEMFHALELAWGLIANASGGDWTKESRDWQDAAARWRDEQFHALIRRFGGHAQARLGALYAPDEATLLRDLLARALPVLKHRAVDGSGEAEALVGEVQGALAEGNPVRRRDDSGAWASDGDHDGLALAERAWRGKVERLSAESRASAQARDAAVSQCEALRADVARLREALEVCQHALGSIEYLTGDRFPARAQAQKALADTDPERPAPTPIAKEST